MFAGFMASDKIVERHRHRYEVNNEYIPRLEQAGLRVSAVSAGEGLCEMIELPASRTSLVCRLPVPPGIYFHPQSRASIVLGVYQGCCQLCE